MYELKTFDGHTFTANDEILAKRAADMLHKHFPGYIWAVNVNSLGGCMFIKNYCVSYRYGYTLHIDKLDAKLRKVLMAGGEILERAKLNRGKWKEEELTMIDGVALEHQPIPKLGIII